MKERIMNSPVVIMAGGFGNRMLPYSSVLPKPLLLYKGKTLIENVIDLYLKHGFRRFYVILCHESELIQSFLERRKPPCEVRYAVEPAPLGTAGGLKLLEAEMDGGFILCNCDNLGDFDYPGLLERYYTLGADILIPVKSVRHIVPFGVIRYDQDLRAEGIDEKPALDLRVSTGIHIIAPEVISLIPEGEKMDMPQLINLAVKNGRNVRCADVSGASWVDMSILD